MPHENGAIDLDALLGRDFSPLVSDDAEGDVVEHLRPHSSTTSSSDYYGIRQAGDASASPFATKRFSSDDDKAMYARRSPSLDARRPGRRSRTLRNRGEKVKVKRDVRYQRRDPQGWREEHPSVAESKIAERQLHREVRTTTESYYVSELDRQNPKLDGAALDFDEPIRQIRTRVEKFYGPQTNEASATSPSVARTLKTSSHTVLQDDAKAPLKGKDSVRDMKEARHSLGSTTFLKQDVDRHVLDQLGYNLLSEDSKSYTIDEYLDLPAIGKVKMVSAQHRQSSSGHSTAPNPTVTADDAEQVLNKPTLDIETENFVAEQALMFENAIRRECWTSLPQDLVDKVVAAHREKESRKAELRSTAIKSPEAFVRQNLAVTLTPGAQTQDRSTQIDVQQDKGKRRISVTETPDLHVPDNVAPLSMAKRHRLKDSVPSRANVFTSVDGRTETNGAGRPIDHANTWSADEVHSEGLPRAPSPPSRYKQLRRKSQASRGRSPAREDLVIALLKDMHGLLLRNLHLSASYDPISNGQHPTAHSVPPSEVSEHDAAKDDEESIKRIEGPPKQRKPRPSKGRKHGKKPEKVEVRA